jgi:anti-sigma factor RsiW
MNRSLQNLEEKLLMYLDNELGESDKASIEQELESNSQLKERIEQLRHAHQAMRTVNHPQPSRNFTQVVMDRLHQYPAQAGFSIRNGILLLAGVLVAAGVASVLVTAGVFDNASTTIDLGQIDLPRQYERALPRIPIDGKMMVNVIILLNLGLAWLVLDRVVLKPFFRRRIQQGI